MACNPKFLIVKSISLGSLLWVTAFPAFAQINPLPGAADPSRILRPDAPDRSWEKLEPERQKPEVVPLNPAGAEQLRFVLNTIQADGMTVYRPDELERLYSGYKGKEISASQLFQIAASLQQKYLDDGYTLTKVIVPGQDIQNGYVHFLVIEGYVSEIEIDGDLASDSIINDLKLRILAMKPLNTIKLERMLLILNDLPELGVNVILATATQSEPPGVNDGRIRLIIQKREKDEHRGSIGINNYGSVFAGPFQMEAAGRIFHVGKSYSELNMLLSGTSSFQEQKYGSVEYAVPVYGLSGAKLSFSAVVARTEPGSNLDELDVKGRSCSLSAKLSYPVIRQRAETLIADFDFTAKDSRTTLLGDELYDDRQRIASAGLSYSFSDAWSGYNLLDAHVAKGLDILGVRETGSENLSRLDGRPDFTLLRMSAGRLQALADNFEIYAMAAGQYTNTPLLSSEEFGFGGERTGRGYNPSEISGDRGVSLTLELRHHSEASWGDIPLAIQPYGFIDSAKTWNIDFGDTTHSSAVSAGFGVEFSVSNQWDMNFALGFPLTRAAENAPGYSSEYGPRLLMSISSRF